jgi:hypothetical protein
MGRRSALALFTRPECQDNLSQAAKQAINCFVVYSEKGETGFALQ